MCSSSIFRFSRNSTSPNFTPLPTSEDHTFEFWPILTILMRQAKNTLKWACHYFIQKRYVARISLENFPKLRSVYLDWTMVFRLPNLAGRILSSRLRPSLEKLLVYDHKISFDRGVGQISNTTRPCYSPMIEDIVSSTMNGVLLLQSFYFSALCGLRPTLRIRCG